MAFGYKLLSFYLLSASQLFQVPIGHYHYLDFYLAARDPGALDTDSQLRSAASSLQVKAPATKEEPILSCH